MFEISQFRNGNFSMKNFSYLLWADTGEAAVIDPSFDASPLLEFAEGRGLKIQYILLTHHHFDHVTDAWNLSSRTGGRIAAFKGSVAKHDLELSDGQVIPLGKYEIRVMHTPGHTADSVCYLAGGAVFTGDTLFVGECGRVDLEDSSPEDMYESLLVKLYGLPDETLVYPGHDYGHSPHSTIGLEKKENYTMQKRSREEFLQFIRS